MRLLDWSFRKLGSLVLTWGVGCSDDGVPTAASAGDETSTGGTSSGLADGSGGSVSTASATTDPTTATSSGTGSPTDGGMADEGSDTSAADTETGDGTGGESMTCEGPADCVIFDDCCTCMAAHAGDRPPPCPVRECDQSACDAAGLGNIGAECQSGVCQFEEVDCNQLSVVCDGIPPECPDGYLPSVEGGCWTHACVPAEACNYVPDCGWCGDQACVEVTTQLGPLYACEPIPAPCGGVPTCACMPDVCDTLPFDTCTDDGQGGIGCSCPAC